MSLLSLIPKLSRHDEPSKGDPTLLTQDAPGQSQDVSPGILVIAHPLRVVHMNQRAMRLMDIFLNSGDLNFTFPKTATGLLPTPVLDICKEIFDLLDNRPGKDSDQFEVRRVIGALGHQLMLRGFGIPDPRGKDHQRLVLLMEPIVLKYQNVGPEVIDQFGFTSREQSVVQYLSKGSTNKEIAFALGISLPTVKEHIRHIMEKTHATTRTGVLVQIFQHTKP
jgi:DNA-binding CsgD family transcriptional regulator